jgi:hypothetical protein
MVKPKITFFVILLPLILLVILNLFLVFTPEMGFDALWYHLTLPKLWLLKHQWYFPGGLLYYSAMPRLAETLFTPLVWLSGSLGPKLLQYLAGLGSAIFIWKTLSFLKQSSVLKMVGVSLFYATWLVSWQSGSAYVDLIRTFWETLALYYLVKGSWKPAGLFLGLAIGTKWLSLGSLAIYAAAFGLPLILPALLVSLPWFGLAYYFTGNPLYPLFSGVLNHSFLGLWIALKHLLLAPFYLTFPFDDFLSPLVGILFILSLLSLRSKNQVARRVAWVAVLGSFFSLILDPPSSRFLLPYLPALAISAVLWVSSLTQPKYRSLFILVATLSSIGILGLRLLAMSKYLPLFMGRQDSTSFLIANAYRLPDTFIDTDGFVQSLPADAKILVDKLHNLYYLSRDYDHTSWVTTQMGYDYLITIGEDPQKVAGELIHTNILGIQIYKLL